MKRQTGSIDFGMITSFDTYIKDNLKISHYYGVCETESDIATKTIGFPSNNNPIQLSNGLIITVHFLNKNDVLNPKLDIQNGESAKEIRNIAGNELTTALYKWQDSTVITFQYDGTYWRIQNSDFIEQMTSIKSNMQQWDQHFHLPMITQGTGSVLDNTARSSGEKFTIEVPLTKPAGYDIESCTGISCIKATGAGSDAYLLRGFDFNLVNNELIVQTYWETINATSANNITISVKASYIKILPFADSVRRSPWANGTQF